MLIKFPDYAGDGELWLNTRNIVAIKAADDDPIGTTKVFCTDCAYEGAYYLIALPVDKVVRAVNRAD